jgi:hypothetical protein
MMMGSSKALVALMKVTESTSVANMVLAQFDKIFDHGKANVKESALPLLGTLGQ